MPLAATETSQPCALLSIRVSPTTANEAREPWEFK